MNATAQNAGIEYPAGPQAGTVFSFKVDAAPTVASVQINDGAAQRSKVSSVTVTFNGMLAAADFAPGAFTLNRAEGGAFTATVSTVATAGRQSLVTLGFASAGVGADGALPDGTYSLSIDRDRAPIDSPATVVEIAAFQTVFGDLDGNGTITAAEVAAAAQAHGKSGGPDYAWYLDFNADGKIDGTDQREVARRDSSR
jgi:hypothetical protein